jgi:hypothetical protein
MIFWSNTSLINSSRSNRFLSASVCCVVTKDVVKPKYYIPMREIGSSSGLYSSGKLVFVINEAQL